MLRATRSSERAMRADILRAADLTREVRGHARPPEDYVAETRFVFRPGFPLRARLGMKHS